MILSDRASALFCYYFVGRIIFQWRRPNNWMRNLSDSARFCLHLSRLINNIISTLYLKYWQLLTFMKQLIVNKLSVKEFLKDVSIDGWRSTRVRWRPSTMRNTRRRLFWWRRCCRATIVTFFDTLLRQIYVKELTRTQKYFAKPTLTWHQQVFVLIKIFYFYIVHFIEFFLLCFDLMR